MANPIESKSRAQVAPQTKTCTKCGKEKELTAFYVNRDFKEQNGRDAWCKDCVAQCSTRSQIKEYFWENNREWNEKIWDVAQKKAERAAEGNTTIQRMNEERREKILERMIVQAIPSSMSAFYSYTDHSEQQFVPNPDDDTKDFARTWNDEWYGSFTKREIDYLNNQYKSLASDKEIDSTTDDYLHRIAKQRLTCDKLQDDFAAGKCDYSVVKDSLNILDMLHKSANLAACKRKEDSATTLSYSEISKYLEEHNHPMTKKIEWEKDVVDMIAAEFRYTVTEAIGEDV